MRLSSVKLQYERISPTSRTWHDAGSGAHRDGSFWAKRNSNGFYPLGDAVCDGHGPCKNLIRVKDVSSDNILTQEGFDNEVEQLKQF